jgi:hypothetical protein
MLNGLEEVFWGWMGLPTITEREAARSESSVGGQGMIRCNCKGICNSVPAGKQIGNVTPDVTREMEKCKNCVREFKGSAKEMCQLVVPAATRKKYDKKKRGGK